MLTDGKHLRIMHMKKSIILLMALSVIVSSCCSSGDNSCSSSETTQRVQTTAASATGTETITAKVIRVGRYFEHMDYATETGTVLIFENGHVFKRKDATGGAFACAVKEGDVVTYERTPDGKITLKGFVVPQN